MKRPPPPGAGGKEISRLKVAVTAACPLRCSYCFLNKDSGEVLSWRDAERAAKLALLSPGSRKRLQIYGGEPLLRPAFVRRLVRLARALARGRGLRLGVEVATSGLLAREEDADFLRREDVGVALSLDGEPGQHDAARLDRAGRPTSARVERGARFFLERLASRRLTALVAAHPERAGGFARAAARAYGLGFRALNIEVVRGLAWSPAALRAFERALAETTAAVAASCLRGRPLFLESCSAVAAGEAPESPACPVRSSLDLLPDGSYSFYAYAMLRPGPETEAARAGCAREGLSGRFRDCRYEPSSPACRGCAGEYYRLARPRRGEEASLLRARYSEALAEVLRRRLGPRRWAAYRREAAARLWGGR